MKKGFKFNFTVKSQDANGNLTSRNFNVFERAKQEFFYRKNYLHVPAFLFRNRDNVCLMSYPEV